MSDMMSVYTKAFDEGAAKRSNQARAEGRPPLDGWGWEAFPFRQLFNSDIAEMPAWGSPYRDAWLRKQLLTSTLFSSVVYGEATRVKNAEYTLVSEDDNEAELKRAQDILRYCDFGQGFDVFRSKIATDLLTQDNGAFIELISADGRRDSEAPLRGKVASFAYMDAGCCWRSFNPEYPVIYTNPWTGEYHIYHYTRVIALSQFPQGYELGRGMGLSALSRAYEAGRNVISANTYLYEKITGSSPDIHVTNVPFTGMKAGMLSALLQRDAKGFSIFKDPVILSPTAGGMGATPLDIKTLSMKSMPDGFEHRETVELGMYLVAMSFGVDAREYWPVPVGALGGSDAEMQDLKSQSKGQADILNMLEGVLQWRVFMDSISFAFRSRNAQIEQREAQNKLTRVQARAMQISTGELNLEEARQLAAEDGDIDPSFLARSVVAEQNVSVEAQADAPVKEEQPAAVADEDAPPDAAEKALLPTKVAFGQRFEDTLTAANDEQLNRSGFRSNAKAEIRRGMEQSFQQGLRDAGYYGPPNRGQRKAMNELIGQQLGYLDNVTALIFNSDEPISAETVNVRTRLWQNKAIGGAYNAGLLRANKKARFMFVLGKTDKHCATCLPASAQVHSAQEWLEANILPQGDNLMCGGFHCDCSLKQTSLPITGKLSDIPTKGLGVAPKRGFIGRLLSRFGL